MANAKRCVVVTVHDYGSSHGGISWSNPRTQNLDPIEQKDFEPDEHRALCDAIVEQVAAQPNRPARKSEYEFVVLY